MKFEVFNTELFFQKDLAKNLKSIFPEKNDVVNIIFVDEEEIQKLNREFRRKDEVTDVLSFASTAEIYVCPEYIKGEVDDFERSVLRMIIHGILHILGHTHKGYFDPKNINEKMFQLQEMYLQKFYDILKK
jgi:probable rRNA maturation factor